jgi:opacity protein-like surface antigen
MKLALSLAAFLLPLPAIAQPAQPAPAAQPASAVAQAAPAPASAAQPAAAAAPAPNDDVPHPFRLAFASTSAFGVTHSKFFNQLLGARLDYRFANDFAFGGSLSYVNLKGKDRRVHEALPEATIEYRVPLKRDAFGIPFRFGLGYLPKNGPTLRVGAGVDFALSDPVSLEIIPLEPMIWITRERPEISLNATIALRIAL